METVIFFLIILIFSTNIILLFSFFRKKPINNDNKRDNNSYNSFSVLISAKNESENIKGLIESLSSLDYPTDKFEVIIVDDNSSDDTYELLIQHSKSLDNFKIIKSGNKELPGKKGALQKAFDLSKNKYIVTTDADCIVPANWLSTINDYINNGADVIIGNVLYLQNRNFLKDYFRFEQIKNRFLSFSLARLGLPYTAAGANFCFNREILEKIGGYKAISQTLSGDDDLLVQQAVKLNYKITTMNNSEKYVTTIPPESFKAYLKQKKRHTAASNHYLLKNQILLSYWHLLNQIGFLSFLLVPFYYNFIYIFISKLFFDFLTVNLAAKEFKQYFYFHRLLLYPILYELLIPINYIRATFGKESWKD